MTSLISKVQKLVAMSASPHIEEARTSSFMACKLIREHGLEIVLSKHCDEKTEPNKTSPPQKPFVPITVKHTGYCISCGKLIYVGEIALWRKGEGLLHFQCKLAYATK